MKNQMRKMVSLLLALAVAILIFPLPTVNAKAAATVVMTTTSECSIWSAPATLEQNRVKKVPAGYPITVYKQVVKSSIGDGKTFYKTVKGSYVLCKCLSDGTTTPAVSSGKDYKTPYSTSNTTLVPAKWMGKDCFFFGTTYNGAPAYAAITFYMTKEYVGKIAYLRDNCRVPAGLPVMVWGYTTDGYYICGQQKRLISLPVEDDLTLIPMNYLTEKVPSKVLPLSEVVPAKAKPNPYSDNYDYYSFCLVLVPHKAYGEYIAAYGPDAYTIGGQKIGEYWSNQDYWKREIELETKKAPTDDYLHMVYEGQSYETNVQRMKALVDDFCTYYYPANSFVNLVVPIDEFTPNQFRAMRKEVYNYTLNKYGSARMGAVRLFGEEWYSSPDTSSYAYRPDCYYHFMIGR